MTDRYESVRSLAEKVEWEGGVTEAITEYGIFPDALPEGTPQSIIHAWTEVYESRGYVDEIATWLYQEMGDDEE